MGEEIIIKDIQVIQGGLIQIDVLNVDTNECWRAFCEPNKFFKMIGKSMQKEVVKQANEYAVKMREVQDD